MVCTKKRTSQYKTSRQASARSLNDLPMTFSKSDSSGMAERCRLQRGEKSAESRHAGNLSRRLLSDSKRLFNMALIEAHSLPPPPPQTAAFMTTCTAEDDRTSLPPVHRELNFWSSRDTLAAARKPANTTRDCYSSQSHRRRATHTGPTQYGSLLYGSKTPLITEPVRFDYEPPPEYFRATPDIEKCLRESNRLYRTVTNEMILPLEESHTGNDAISTRSIYSSARYLLVPTMNKAETPRRAEGVELAPMRQVLAGEHVESVGSEDGAQEEEEVPVINVEQCAAQGVDHDQVINAGLEERLDDIERDQNKPMDGKQAEIDTANVKVNVEQSQPELPQKESKSNQNSPRLETKTKEKVTDATLKLPGNGKLGLKKTSTTGSPRDNKGANSKRPVRGKGRKGKRVEVVESEGEEEAETLPGFICPSSEDKSREAYCRTWLRQNTFTRCSRLVPLE